MNGAPEEDRSWIAATGYSLVEVVVALVILATGLLGAAGLVTTAARHVAMAVEAEVALTLAEGVADSLMSHGWGGPGDRRQGSLLVTWSGSEGWGTVTVTSLDGAPLVRIPIPVIEP